MANGLLDMANAKAQGVGQRLATHLCRRHTHHVLALV